ncbi:uncharacterized protein LOC134812832 [Bolinopsis microptera]|uniref:uncharacterized protein LOC134812832 n=1 Tax=Bolinopsis microptera TaxID=2820187 RepID=UPI003079449F
MDKTITVIGSYGEVVSTDRIVFAISCSSSKPTADEARDSVDKRQKYISQSCINDGGKDVRENCLMAKSGDMFTFIKETRVTLSSTEKLDTLRNKFVEKLDNSIKLHDTLYGFKEKTLAETSKRTFTNACRVATDKANHLCNNMDVKLGECIKIEELSSDWIQNSDLANNFTEREYRCKVQAQYGIIQ